MVKSTRKKSTGELMLEINRLYGKNFLLSRVKDQTPKLHKKSKNEKTTNTRRKS